MGAHGGSTVPRPVAFGKVHTQMQGLSSESEKGSNPLIESSIYFFFFRPGVIISLTRSCMSVQTGKSLTLSLNDDEIFAPLKYQLMRCVEFIKSPRQTSHIITLRHHKSTHGAFLL